jgi:hypothetical protein
VTENPKRLHARISRARDDVSTLAAIAMHPGMRAALARADSDLHAMAMRAQGLRDDGERRALEDALGDAEAWLRRLRHDLTAFGAYAPPPARIQGARKS